MKRGKLLFWVLVGAYLLLALADGALTYIGTPDLAYEANPLVAVFGLGWGALFIANALVFALQIVAVNYAFVRYQSPLLPYKEYKEFLSMLIYDRPDKFIWTFYKLPKNWKPFFAQLGYAMGIALPVGRLAIVFQWVLYLANSPIQNIYNPFRNWFPYGRFDIVLTAFVGAFLAVYWTFRECRINRMRMEKSELVTL
ncbi:MAG: hypothetical protein FWF10_05425 [Clostridiales bacterium]|nr:hypothetical protein [Clostridiales bacterium]